MTSNRQPTSRQPNSNGVTSATALAARQRSGRRIVVALGGNAMTGPDGRALPDAQRAAVELAMDGVAELLVAGHQVILTHGNGPQVGNLVVQNDLAKGVVPALPLDWCVAETQATLGMLIVTALERALADRGAQRQVVALVSRVLVAEDDPAWQRPTKPIGGFVDKIEARAGTTRGLRYQQAGTRGWRRVVPSPEPLELLDAPVLRGLIDQGVVVVAAGGGGIPMVREGDRLRGVEAVLDKDLTAVLLAQVAGADTLVIATDVDQVSTAFGTPSQRPIGRIAPAELRAFADAGHFASGSMAPKVEAAIRFVTAAEPPPNGAAADRDRHGAGAVARPPSGTTVTGHGRRAVITSLARLADAVAGNVGTIVEALPDPDATRTARVSTAT